MSRLSGLGQLLITATSVVLLVFFMVRWVPGDPVDALLGEGASAEARAQLASTLGLDQPWSSQLKAFLTNLSRGDFGISYSRGVPVSDLIWERYQSTLVLGFSALGFAVLVAIFLGTLAAIRRGGWLDRIVLLVSTAGISIPNFWLGPMLVLVFAVILHWLPVSGAATPAHYVLPVATLGLSLFSTLVRVVRASVLETLQSDYIRTAIAKGNSFGRVYFIHALKNAGLPIITQVSLQAGAVLAGTLVTETIFDWPGLGSLMFQAIKARDYPIIQATVLLVSLTYVIINSIAEALYGWADPRIQ